MVLSLDFKHIREHRGTQNGGFEELCCQLAALEDPATGYLALLRVTANYRLRPLCFSLTERSTCESERHWADVEQANQAFKDALSDELRTKYAGFAEHHLLESTRMGDDNRRPPEVDHGPVRRWICERAHQLGWTEALFEGFERGGNNGNDNSVDDGFSLYLPSSGVMKVLDLHLRSGKAPEYVDAGGTLRWQDPSLRSRGSGAGVVSHSYFLGKLDSAGLEPVWVLAGEKNVYAGQDLGVSMGGFGGCLYHTTTFAMDAGLLKSFGTRTEFHVPSAEQLDKLKAR